MVTKFLKKNKQIKKGSLIFFFFLIFSFLSRLNSQFYFIDLVGHLGFQIIIAGILLLGEMEVKSSLNCSPAVISILTILYATPNSSRKMLTFRPFGVGQ